MNRAPEIPKLCEEKKATRADIPFSAEISPHMSCARQCSDPTEFSDNGSWSGDQDPCNPQCQRPCKNHNVELSSSDEDMSGGLEQIAPTVQRIGSLKLFFMRIVEQII